MAASRFGHISASLPFWEQDYSKTSRRSWWQGLRILRPLVWCLAACQYRWNLLVATLFQSTASVGRDDDGLGGGKLGVSEAFRHIVLLFRLQRPYLIYCTVCCLLAVAAFVSTLVSLLSSHQQLRSPVDAVDAARLALEPSVGGKASTSHGAGGDALGGSDAGEQLCALSMFQAALEGGRWQSFCWNIVALALFGEVVATAVVHGASRFCEDMWSFLDLAALTLTILAWALMRYREAMVTGAGPDAFTSRELQELEGADLSLLTLRFALQLYRVWSSFQIARKVQQMHQSDLDIPEAPMSV
eukprot:TRINITY_DN45636_c0_g1_i2.p1 TRINITY_DN45636_c0_g1~~TRINITY_DN45636_c0_g1_i2.p1  ORF type:complete len:314 (+),score=53.36 TRINITY_DN45636_c0_g1_i2:41-943(+)